MLAFDNKHKYDAAGNKLSKTVTETGQPTKTTTCLEGMLFEKDTLQHIVPANAGKEGRLRPTTPTATTFVSDYFLKDHLGNVRAMITDDPNQTNKLLEETHYYPFGLVQRGISSTTLTGVPENKKKFIGQLLDDDLGLNWYQFKYRNHDPQIGRFTEVDPLATKYVYNSTYAYAENKVGLGFDLEGLELQGFNEMFRAAGINIRQANKTTQTVAANVAKKAEPVISVTKDVITIGGGVTLLVGSGGTAAPVLVGVAGSATITGGAMKLVFDISGNKEVADKIPTTLSGTAIFLTNGASEAAMGKKFISDDVKTVAEFSEGILTFKVTGFNKMSDVEKASTVLSGMSLTLDAINPETAKSFQTLLGAITEKNTPVIKQDSDNIRIDNTYAKPPLMLPAKVTTNQ